MGQGLLGRRLGVCRRERGEIQLWEFMMGKD